MKVINKVLILFYIYLISLLLLINFCYPIILSFGFSIGLAHIIISHICSFLLVFLLTRKYGKLNLPGDNLSNFIHLIGIFFVCYFCYKINAATSLEQRQDPGAYLHKTWNLINFGDVHRDISYLNDENVYFNPNYRGLLRGSKVFDNKLVTDFYYGPSLTYFHFSKIFNDWILFSPFIIQLAVGFLIYFFISSISKDTWIGFGTFLIVNTSIPYLFFARNSYSEPISFLYILCMIYVIYDKKLQSKISSILLFILLSCLMFCRLDGALVAFPIAFIILNQKFNKYLKFVLIGLPILIYYLAQYNTLYFMRISKNQYIFEIWIFLYTISILIFILFYYLKKRVKISDNLLITIISNISIIILVSLPFMFLLDDIMRGLKEYFNFNFARNYISKTVEREDINMSILSSLFYPFLVVFTLLKSQKIFKGFKFDLNFILFIFFLLVVSCLLIDNGRNSKHLFWYARRYIIYSLPLLIVLWGLAAYTVSNNVSRIILLTAIILQLNTTLVNYPKKEYNNLHNKYNEVSLVLSDCEKLCFTPKHKDILSPFINSFRGKLYPNRTDGGKNLMSDHCDCLVSPIKYNYKSFYSTKIIYERPKMFPLRKMVYPNETDNKLIKLYIYKK